MASTDDRDGRCSVAGQDPIETLRKEIRKLSIAKLEQEIVWDVPEETTSYCRRLKLEEDAIIEREFYPTKESQKWLGNMELCAKVKWRVAGQCARRGLSFRSEWSVSIVRKEKKTGRGVPFESLVLHFQTVKIGEHIAELTGHNCVIANGEVTTTYNFHGDPNWNIFGVPVFQEAFDANSIRAIVGLVKPEPVLGEVALLVRKTVAAWKMDGKKTKEVLEWLQDSMEAGPDTLRLVAGAKDSNLCVEFYVPKSEAVNWSFVFETATKLGLSDGVKAEHKFEDYNWRTVKDFLVLCKFGTILEVGYPTCDMIRNEDSYLEPMCVEHRVDCLELFKLAHREDVRQELLSKVEVYLVQELLNASARRCQSEVVKLMKFCRTYELRLMRAVVEFVIREKFKGGVELDLDYGDLAFAA